MPSPTPTPSSGEELTDEQAAELRAKLEAHEQKQAEKEAKEREAAQKKRAETLKDVIDLVEGDEFETVLGTLRDLKEVYSNDAIVNNITSTIFSLEQLRKQARVPA